MRKIFGSLSALVLVLSLGACSSIEGVNFEQKTYDAPELRTTDLIPNLYAGQHEIPVAVSPDIPEEHGLDTVEISGEQVADGFPVESAEAAPLPPGAQLEANISGRRVNETFFNHGSARLGSIDKQKINAVAKDISVQDPAPFVTVVGHASTRVDGSADSGRREEINFGIAQKRAVAVSEALGAAGVEPARITAVSKGDAEPNANPGGRSQEAADRRVEIFVSP